MKIMDILKISKVLVLLTLMTVVGCDRAKPVNNQHTIEVVTTAQPFGEVYLEYEILKITDIETGKIVYVLQHGNGGEIVPLDF